MLIKIRKNIQFTYQKYVDLLLLREEGKRHCVLIKDFNTFTYNQTLHRGRKHFCRYCLQVLSTEEILKRGIIDCCKINGKQTIIMPKRDNRLNSKIMKKIKSPFMIYAYFESTLMPEYNGKQNAKESYTNKYQKHFACSYGD